MFEFKGLNLSNDVDLMIRGGGDEEIFNLFDVVF
jgi:hypothetical protein